ncbi:MAG TPA: peptidoglycan DD-metalloendopeptidase family protein, partial [Mariprofundaceae bacterium]|nr:peptidoglycan DD-metalloendopeptidase family protein [Mariprofundaceae bacterium]
RLKRRMAQEAAAAYQRDGRQPGLADILQGVSMAAIPHHQYMAARLMATQAEDRRNFHDSVVKLQKVEKQTRRERQRLSRLQAEKEKKRRHLAMQRSAKQHLWNRVRHSARLKRQRDKQLAEQETALKRLLKGLGASTLLAEDKATDWVSVRRLKGKLPWPLKGRIMAHFHSRPARGRPRLAGVLLAPKRGAGQVKAIAPGQVRYADWFGGYGLMLIVDHGQGLMSVYAHNDVLYKHLGDWVDTGDVLADVGSTGWVEHVRLYFEMRDRGRPTNPVRWCHR